MANASFAVSAETRGQLGIAVALLLAKKETRGPHGRNPARNVVDSPDSTLKRLRTHYARQRRGLSTSAKGRSFYVHEPDQGKTKDQEDSADSSGDYAEYSFEEYMCDKLTKYVGELHKLQTDISTLAKKSIFEIPYLKKHRRTRSQATAGSRRGCATQYGRFGPVQSPAISQGRSRRAASGQDKTLVHSPHRLLQHDANEQETRLPISRSSNCKPVQPTLALRQYKREAETKQAKGTKRRTPSFPIDVASLKEVKRRLARIKNGMKLAGAVCSSAQCDPYHGQLLVY